MPYFKSGASDLYYEEYGAGPPVLLLHGVGGNHASWFNQVPHFSRRYRTIIMDQRAFGNSEDVEQIGRTAFVDDVIALLDHLGIEKIFLVGQSMGGGTVSAVTALRPNRVAGTFICDSIAGPLIPASLSEEFAELSRRNANLTQQERVLGPKIRAADKERSLLYTQIASFNSVNFRTVRGDTPPWSVDQLVNGGVPIVFVVGEDDILCPPKFLEAAHKQIPGSKFHVLKDSGHSAYFETPEPFNELVLEQLDSWIAAGLLAAPAPVAAKG